MTDCFKCKLLESHLLFHDFDDNTIKCGLCDIVLRDITEETN